MAQVVKFALAGLVVGLLSPVNASPLKELGPSDDARERPSTPARSGHVPVSERYATLDDYLAYLEKSAALDNAWYRRIQPGVYRLETGNFRGSYKGKRIFTRAELLQKYGFRK